MTVAGRGFDARERATPVRALPTARHVPARGPSSAARTAAGDPAVAERPADVLAAVLARAVALRASDGPAQAPTARMALLARTPDRTLARKKADGVADPQKYTHQTQNPALLETIYPHRERALRKFVEMYREIELRDFTAPADRAGVIKRATDDMGAEIERLKSKPAFAGSAAEIKALEKRKQHDQEAGDEAWKDAVEWELSHRGDPLAGAALQAEVDRLITSKAVPKWVGPMVRDYVGMRYKSAHGSYLSPVRLLYTVEDASGTWATARTAEGSERNAEYERKLGEWNAKGKRERGAAPRKPGAAKWSAAESAAMHTSPAAAVARIEQMYQAGQIPQWAWHKIVRLTELRTRYATEDWESTKLEQPGTSEADLRWKQIMKSWEKDSAIAGSDVKQGHGTTAWRDELNTRNALITTRMVCNELSEAALRHRGISLHGGISGDVQDFQAQESEGVVGAYFKQLSSASDLRPGATLFFLNRDEWRIADKKGKPPNHTLVRAVPGATYPMPPPPEDVQEWNVWDSQRSRHKKELDKWKQASKAGKASGPMPAPYSVAEPKSDKPDYVPANGTMLKGWLYTVVAGQPIKRTKGSVTHWLGWKHQAQVLRVWPDGRVFTLETTVESVPDATGKKQKIEYSGFRVHQLKEMIEHHAFVGFLPGEDTPASAPAAAPAAAP
ncbi:MAG: hypothetical protein QOJ46_406 [bacterium]